MSFKDFIMVEWRPGMDDHINYMVHKRRRLGEESTEEALDFVQRKARARTMKKFKAKIAMGQRKAKKRAASPEKILNRAKRLARTTMFKKLSKGKAKNELPFQRRQEIEKRLEKMKGRIEKMARKNIPVVRKIERDRRSKKSEK